jgi:hypothetical protein
MRYGKLLMCAASVLAVTACDDDGVTVQGDPPPAALVRFINTVPDTGTVDFRFIDKVENLPTLLNVPFRGASGLFQRADPGARPARVFPSSSTLALTQIMLVDTMLTLTANNRYTLVYAGRAAGNQDRLAVITEAATIPIAPANQISLKILHAAVGTGAVDVYVTPTTGTANPANPIADAVTVVRNVAFLGQSAYVNVPVRPATGNTHYAFTVTAAGSTTPLFTARPNLPGTAVPAGQTYGAQPGFQVSGSVLTVVVTAGSVPGTRQSTTATQTPNAFVIVDRTLDP